MEHAVEALCGQGCALVEQRAGACFDARVGQQVGWRLELVGQDEAVDGLAGERASLQQRAGESCADEAGASCD